MRGCSFCSVKLELHVSCSDDTTLEVTSNHLDVVPYIDDDAVDTGDEIAKRTATFGHPVGKGESSSLIYFTAATSSNLI